MDAAAHRPEFAPPPPPGLLRGFGLAVLAHLLLLLALTHGLQWKRDAQVAVAEAELWASVPREAAPKEVPQPPPPPPAPAVKPPPPPAPDPALQREAQIALEREKERRALEKQKQLQIEKQKQAEREKQHQAELERERDERRKVEARKKREAEELARKKEEQAKVAAAEARRKEEARERQRQQQEASDAKRREELRQQTLKRMQALANGTGAPDATGSAAHSAGPSASWGAKVQARVRPNIVFTDTVRGNPKAEVEVRAAPDGTIVGKRLVRSSGVKEWDDAVLRALDKTESLPRDTDGRVPSPVVIEFRPHV